MAENLAIAKPFIHCKKVADASEDPPSSSTPLEKPIPFLTRSRTPNQTLSHPSTTPLPRISLAKETPSQNRRPRCCPTNPSKHQSYRPSSSISSYRTNQTALLSQRI